MHNGTDIKKGYTPTGYRPPIPMGHNPGEEGSSRKPPTGTSGVPRKKPSKKQS